MAKGYTKIENELFDFMISGSLKGSELEVMWFLIRYTKGFGRETTKASYGFIAKGLQCSETKVKRAFKRLEEKGIISVYMKASGCRAQVVKINWAKLHYSCGQNRPHYMGGNDHKKVGGNDHQDIIQDNTNLYITQEERDLSFSEWEKMNEEEDFDD